MTNRNLDHLGTMTERAAYALDLAAHIDGAEEVTLSITDNTLCAEALRHYQAFLDANTP